jgi:hypothetical protein
MVGSRATTMAELQVKLASFISTEGRAAGLAFQPRPTDVVITPYPKCGTTWLQQMVHSLRTGGDLDFDDISRVVPWIETAADLGLDLEAEQRAQPRAFKSHLPWTTVPKGGRYLVAVRDPRDALVSVHRFFEGWFFEPGSIDVETLGRARFLEGRSYYEHLVSWWEHRDDPEVLLLAYEQMLAAPEETVRRVAAFIGVEATDERLATALDESSLATMRANENRYDDCMMRAWSERNCDLPPGSASGKVGTGGIGSHRGELSEAFLAELDATWRETIGVECGLDSYEALLAALAVHDESVSLH